MRHHVLARAVTGDDGRVYPEGTTLDRLPESNRDSLIGTGWTRLVPVDQSHPEQSDGASDPDAAAASTAVPDSADTDTVAETPADDAGAEPAIAEPTDIEPAVVDATAEADESPAISSLDLSPEIVELLAGAGVTTVAEAIAHRAAHGSFRTIKKIGKASDALITAAIDGE